MECLFLPELTQDTKLIDITDDEFTHLKALRLNISSKVEAINGNGLKAEIEIFEMTKKKASAKVNSMSFIEPVQKRISLALGILDSRDRFEFALEKAIELGIYSFFPLACDNSQRKIFSKERLNAKAIAALKQCKRSYLPIISSPLSIDELLRTNKDSTFYFADMESKEKLNIVEDNLIILIGPEGGFSEREIQLMKDSKVKGFTLGETRLRAETAAIASITLGTLL